MDVQVQPGEGDENRDDQGGNAHLLAVLQQHHRCLEGGDGVAGGEGEVALPVNQQVDVHAEILLL